MNILFPIYLAIEHALKAELLLFFCICYLCILPLI